ncbi:hypothetical protein [Flavobacterium sp.]|uniref:hypothetical protein n=1 Tax=Flavobacterium sp. TaxID=239 RepID=UPI004047BFDB
MKHQLMNFLKANSEIIAFMLVVLAGVGVKTWKAMQENTKLSFKWFIAEGFMSALVAFTAYMFFDKMLNLDKILVYIICAWLGSASTVFHKKVEELVGKFFEALGSWITKKIEK